ncbi:MAG: cold shock domain-containing protein [Pirellulaceae bacterium]|nr:cold shock domain-containing protein [Pirellulaceae bacterium]
MQYGTVIRYFPQKGYGFIRPERGPDVFFHISSLGACQAVPDIQAGQPVKYDLEVDTDPQFARRRPHPDDEPSERSAAAVQPRARLVELIDKLPGVSLDEVEQTPEPRHPKARRRKPTWRR